MSGIEKRFRKAMDDERRRMEVLFRPNDVTDFGEVCILKAGVRVLVQIVIEQDVLIRQLQEG